MEELPLCSRTFQISTLRICFWNFFKKTTKEKWTFSICLLILTYYFIYFRTTVMWDMRSSILFMRSLSSTFTNNSTIRSGVCSIHKKYATLVMREFKELLNYRTTLKIQTLFIKRTKDTGL
jgi:hypothetical protein